MNFYYSFHIIESLASFLKAQQFDSTQAMLYWAEALAYGPNINDLGYTQSPDALRAVQKSRQWAANASSLEKGLIAAMSVRYSEDPNTTREKLNAAYRDAMAGLWKTNPTNPELIALYADALMVMHPWDLYESNGDPKAWTPEMADLLEKGLDIAPGHPGINHYYIHVVEGSRDPGRATPSADRLASIVPSASHMVHMPSHIYIRTGQYAKGIQVNNQSLTSFDNYLKLYPPVGDNRFLYQFHNTHMLSACAIMNGNSDVAVKSSIKCHDDIPAETFNMGAPFSEMIQYIYATPVFAMVRYGKWQSLIDMPMTDSLHYYSLLGNFGKGIALARTGKLDEAEKQLAALNATLKQHDSILRIKAFNSAFDAAMVAKHMLQGIIHEERKNLDAAATSMEQAAILEEQMVYNEPKDWLLPPLQYLGQIQLKQSKFQEAEKSFRKDLAFNPNNCWSLKGLHQALVKQGKSSEAGTVAVALKTAMNGTDITTQGVVY
jgi:tetratricopeptide (TPR) repeat protein